MGRVNIRVPPKIGSLRYCGELLQKYISKTFSGAVIMSEEYVSDAHNIGVDDYILASVYKRKSDVAWMDSPFLPSSRINPDTKLWKRFYTVSEYNRKVAEEMGFRVDSIIPRLINPELFKVQKSYDNLEWDTITIGNHDSCDRKNIRMQRDLLPKLGTKSVFISNIFLFSSNSIVQYKTGTVSEEKKIELLQKSKFLLFTSFVEGFGMPVLEAMATGTPAIYTDCPAHNEFAVGIPVEPSGYIKSFAYGARIDKWLFNPEDVAEAIKYALGMGKEEYMDLSAKCREKALEVYSEATEKIPLLLEEVDKENEVVEFSSEGVEIIAHNLEGVV